MKIQTPPGMRDFYPEDMRLQNWLFGHWRRASLAFGFSEYEGPIFEFLELYQLKSGQEIAEQLFSFSDRGQRRFAIRPEMTPTLARMVAARAGALPRPIKWFSLPRMCRAEKPQRGRLREFFQWNVDVLGSEDPIADAEVIAVAVDFLRRTGLTPADVCVRVSSRPLAGGLLASIGLPPERVADALPLIDRMSKLSDEAFEEAWRTQTGGGVPAGRVKETLSGATIDSAVAAAERLGDAGMSAGAGFRDLWARLGDLGAAEFCQFDATIVRGLAYYTGVVFEVHARAGGLRALFGGGRYDDLTGLLDGPRVPGVGFGAGDAPILEALREFGKLPSLAESLDVFVIDAAESFYPAMLGVLRTLRSAGIASDFSYKRAAVGKQFKQASARGARLAIVVGQELAERGQVTVKDMATGRQELVGAGGLVESVRRMLGGSGIAEADSRGRPLG